MADYSDIVREHAKNPHNRCEMKDADGVGAVGNPICSDVTTVFIKVDDGVLKEITFDTEGCISSVASASMLTSVAKGKTLDEAMKITNEDIIKELGGLPEVKVHCSMMAMDALHKAIEDYRTKTK